MLAPHLRGAVDADRPGTMRTTGASSGSGQDLPTLPPPAKPVHGALLRPADVRELLRRPDVHRALGELRAEGAAAGLLRAFPPVRPRAARRALRELCDRHPLPASRVAFPASPERLATDAVLMAVRHTATGP
ncbi:hypothetical protein ABZV31_05150 [Streptomyces sp. NPDC005202]|uniref:hypothetical protein n=1 Tax=Streptomyces sp. NPDC005202 TaxID=3157021 RepID=UPI0033B539D4